jgi:pimeloyl-ACP methyl ester carboxylesterase
MYTPPSALRLFTARIPNARSVLLPDVGHSAYWEQPAAFNRAVLDFVARY